MTMLLERPGFARAAFADSHAPWYTYVEGGQLHPEAASRPLEPVSIEGHAMRCSCSECLNERDALRTETLAGSPEDKAGKWADRSWNGPLANFPGTTHDDTGRPRRIRPHRRSTDAQ